MANFLDSFSCLSAPNLRAALCPPPTAAPPLAAVSARHSLPELSGLKILPSSKRSLASLNSRAPRVCRGGRGRGIVCESAETGLDVPTVTDVTWQSLVLKADGPVLVEFWAPWCGPCRMIHPVIGELAQQYEGKLKCLKLNTDQSPSIATQYGVRSIPTIMIFINGEKKDAVIGAVPKTTLTASIEKFL